MPPKYTDAQRVAAFWSKVKVGAPDECWPWQGFRLPHGYGRFKWDGRITNAHRVAFFLSNAYLPEGLDVCHACDNPPCCNPKHLFVGTEKENIADSIKKGRFLLGERSGTAKLTVTDIIAIRAAYKTGVTQKQIALRYGVSRQQISKITTGKRWTHLPI